MKIILSIIGLIVCIILALSLLSEKSNSRDLIMAADSVNCNISMLRKIIFSDIPPYKSKMNSCIYLFNDEEDKISANLRIQYNISKNFKFSLIGILLQNNKEIFGLLRKKNKTMIVWEYTRLSTNYYTIPYAIVVPEKSWHGISNENLILPTTRGKGLVYIEKIQINNTPILKLLEISPDGKILNHEKEKLFLENVKKLSR